MAKENGYDFARALRGYSPEEVDAYIDELKAKCASLEEDNALLAERATKAKAELDESNTKRGLAEKELADAEDRAEAIIRASAERAEAMTAEAAARAAKIEEDAKRKADATIGAALLEEKRINEELERKIVEKERIYNAFCDRMTEFKNSVFAMYASHISALEEVLANKVEYSYELPEPGVPTPEPENEKSEPEEIIEPIIETDVAAVSADAGIEAAEKVGIKVTREAPGGEKVKSIMRELDEIKVRIEEKEKKKY